MSPAEVADFNQKSRLRNKLEKQPTKQEEKKAIHFS
jgi:hypothetical protein